MVLSSVQKMENLLENCEKWDYNKSYETIVSAIAENDAKNRR